MTDLTISTNDLVTLSDAAKLLGVSRPTIYNYIEKNHLHPVIIGNNRYLLKAEVEGLLKDDVPGMAE
jgi:excisionase family DNA binding protein